MASYEKIDYRVRPAKCIERKMLCEVFRRLSSFEKIENYKYIGFGSTYFNDFLLFHKALNIKKMISIEKDERNKERFEFNRPFNCIKIKYGVSSEVLPLLNWKTQNICWLDYDGKLDKTVLADIKLLCANALSGSVIVITINAQPEKIDSISFEKIKDHRLEKLRESVGEEKLSAKITGKMLTGWEMAKTCKTIIDNEIEQTLFEENGVRETGNKICYKQLFNFQYADGAKMLTVGGIFYDERQEELFQKCSFHELHFVRNDDEPYRIEVPMLTYKEVRHLDMQLPKKKEGQEINAQGIPIADIDNYEKVYRFFPTFADVAL